MQCEEFEVQLNESLDRRLPLTAADAIAHQRACSPCRERSAAYAAIARELAQLPLPTAPDNLAERVLTELRRPATVPLIRRHRPLLALAAAAALLVSVVGGWALNRGGFFGRASRRQVAGRSDDVEALRRASPRKQVALTRPTKISPTPSAESPREPEKTIASVFPGAETLPAAEWAQQVADGLQPVTRPTLGAATGFLQVWGVWQTRTPPAQRPRS
ncbi:MAG: hypothetical protein ACREPW_08900 [Candidatus Binataceae bacterium]